MASPEEYRRQIMELGSQIQAAQLHAMSAPEMNQAVSEILLIERRLQQVKRNINLDMKAIRGEYRQRMSQPAAVSSSVATLFGKRKLAGQLRADERRRLRIERDRKLAPYEELRLKIDYILTDLDEAKAAARRVLDGWKMVEQGKKQSAKGREASTESAGGGPLCSHCGGPTGDTEAYCPWCGQKLNTA